MLPLVVAVALGVGAVVQRSVVVFTVLKLAGAAYLVYLGVQALRHRHDGPADVVDERPRSAWRIDREGFVVGVSNPKAVVFLAAVLPQFAAPEAGAVAVQVVVLGLVFMTVRAAERRPVGRRRRDRPRLARPLAAPALSDARPAVV